MFKAFFGSLVGKSFGGKILVAGVGAAFLFGMISGGLFVRKIMDGTIAKKEAAQLKLDLEARDASLRLSEANLVIERRLKDAAIEEQGRLEAKLEKREDALNEAYKQTALGLSRVPKDVHTIEVKGNEIGKELASKDDTAWVTYIWPRRLYNHAFREETDPRSSEAAGMSLAGGN